VLAVKWRKLLMNLNNATLAITDNWVQLARVTPRLAHFMAEVMSEGLHTLELAGISLDDPANPYNTALQIDSLRAVTEDPERIAKVRALPPDLRTYPSTWVDLKNFGEKPRRAISMERSCCSVKARNSDAVQWCSAANCRAYGRHLDARANSRLTSSRR
jgi:hypothetical protein